MKVYGVFKAECYHVPSLCGLYNVDNWNEANLHLMEIAINHNIDCFYDNWAEDRVFIELWEVF